MADKVSKDHYRNGLIFLAARHSDTPICTSPAHYLATWDDDITKHHKRSHPCTHAWMDVHVCTHMHACMHEYNTVKGYKFSQGLIIVVLTGTLIPHKIKSSVKFDFWMPHPLSFTCTQVRNARWPSSWCCINTDKGPSLNPKHIATMEQWCYLWLSIMLQCLTTLTINNILVVLAELLPRTSKPLKGSQITSKTWKCKNLTPWKFTP